MVDTKILHFEPTSKCNAACPMCARNVDGKGCIVSLSNLSLEDYQLEIIKNIKTIEKVFFCGTVGDPCADSGLLEKIKWIKKRYITLMFFGMIKYGRGTRLVS